MAAGKTENPLVVIVDDDEGMRESVGEILRSVGIETVGFGSTAAMLATQLPDRPGCLILDVRLPGLGGLELQSKLIAMGNKLPVIFMTGFGDVPMTVRAMKAGALDFLTKPFRDQEILDAVSVAIDRDISRRSASSVAAEVEELAGSLTPREYEVMESVVAGRMNKQIAHQLGVSEITVKVHRSRVMQKMRVTSVADLVRKVELLKQSA
jgi:FixJ family two-component response regulator